MHQSRAFLLASLTAVASMANASSLRSALRHHSALGRATTAQNFGLASLKLAQHPLTNASEASGTYYTSAYTDAHLMSYSATTFHLTASARNAAITIKTSEAQQIIDGFGTALTDASAMLLGNLKSKSFPAYQNVMKALFNPISGQRIVRIPMGSCDFSMKLWTYRDARDDKFDLGPAAEYQIPVLQDAVKLNPRLNIMLSPWSPPKWMKTIDNLAGGQLNMSHLNDLAEYYTDAASAFANAGVTPSHMSIQNEPTYWGEYPSMRMDTPTQLKVASALRKALDKRGLRHVKILAHDNNYRGWGDALDILNGDNDHDVDGIGFHCYRGDISQVSSFNAAAKEGGFESEVHMTECSASEASQTRYNAMQWWLGSMFFPILAKTARSVILWNLALTSAFGPHLPTAYCTDCRASITIDETDVSVNSQTLVIGHFSAASSDMHTYGGGYSRVVSTVLSQHLDCIKGVQAFAAPLDGTHLQTSPRKRIGIVIQSDCGAAIDNVSFDIDGRAFSKTVQPGLTTFLFVTTS